MRRRIMPLRKGLAPGSVGLPRLTLACRPGVRCGSVGTARQDTPTPWKSTKEGYMEQPPPITTESLLQAVETLRPILEAQVSQSETDRQLAAASYDAMRAAGLFRMLVPRVF